MVFNLTIHCDNAAFDGTVLDANREVAHILRKLADRLTGEVDDTNTSWPMLDSNGNTVGAARFLAEPSADYWLARAASLEEASAESESTDTGEAWDVIRGLVDCLESVMG